MTPVWEIENKTKRHVSFLIRSLLVIFFASSIFSCKKNEPVTPPPPAPSEPFFIRGLDLSFTPEILSFNISFFDSNEVKPILQLAQEKGINTIRLRLWYAPATVHSSLPEVMEFAKQIKAQGLKFWLDFHYSDTWADPAIQTKPAAWSNLSFEVLNDSISAYTQNTLTALAQNNAAPDFVQVGNETNNGILWEDGKIYTTSGEDWSNFKSLLEEAITAVRTVLPTTAIIVHYAGLNGSDDYFQNLTSLNADFDIIGLSYYPNWHGKDLATVETVIDGLSSKFQKPVVIAETAYPWTLGWNDWTNNLIGLDNQLIPEFPATPEGQANFMSALVSIMKQSSDYDNAGVCYWAADWVAFKGPMATDGSTWENQALFDFEYKALPALDSLGKSE